MRTWTLWSLNLEVHYATRLEES